MNDITKEKILISVIMPAFNSQKYIENSIKSVIAQTYEYWELIVIDDGSVDNTVKVIEELSCKDQRIRCYKNTKNIGVSATRNKGLTLANGDWVAFLDSDDIWDSLKLEKQMIFVRQVNAEFIFTGSKFIDQDGKSYPGVFEIPKEVEYKKLLKHNVISCSSVLLKKNLLREIKMENDDMHEDYAVWLRLLKAGVLACGINEPLLIYRISKGSKSGKKFKTMKMTYKVYRFVGLNPISSVYFVCRHIFASIKKYRKIKIG